MYIGAGRWVRLIAVSVALASASSTSPARAEEEFDISISGHEIVVKAKGSWHINKKYPWKLTAGDVKLGSDKFVLSDSSAKVVAPAGECKLRGGVCSGDECRMFQKTLTIR